jgi:hypothetical protein
MHEVKLEEVGWERWGRIMNNEQGTRNDEQGTRNDE